MKRLVVAVFAALVLVTGVACGGGGSTKPKPPPNQDDKFWKDCILKGGKPVIVHNNGKTNRSCIISGG